MITVTRTVKFEMKHRRLRIVARSGETGGAAPGAAPARVPRIAKLVALAIRFERLLRDGVVADQSTLAQLAHVSQPRMTQILNLNHLAPDIQEELLFLPLVDEGKDAVHERMLREVCAEIHWRKQRALWQTSRGAITNSASCQPE